ncbi:MAG TPA: hypothetical protein VNU95_06955 [Candidatus Acidoferrales bacterium]|nr:hypothetical protein [Candidatus Acidoferrales bacterium]
MSAKSFFVALLCRLPKHFANPQHRLLLPLASAIGSFLVPSDFEFPSFQEASELFLDSIHLSVTLPPQLPSHDFRSNGSGFCFVQAIISCAFGHLLERFVQSFAQIFLIQRPGTEGFDNMPGLAQALRGPIPAATGLCLACMPNRNIPHPRGSIQQWRLLALP